VVRALAAVRDRLPDGERILRALCRQIVDQKGFFALHVDERSHLMYGLMFWLYSSLCTARSFGDRAIKEAGSALGSALRQIST
jgi:hypothetical protein